MYKIDSFFVIGESHDVCEDYILHGEIEHNNINIPYIILSDGCSSSKNTDIGSRILVHSAKKQLKNMIEEIECTNDINTNVFGIDILFNCIEIANNINLDVQSLDATLMIAVIYNNKCYILTYGDGSHIIQNKDNSFQLSSFEFYNNMPYYLSYLRSDDLINDYKKIIGDYKTKHIYEKTKDDNQFEYKIHMDFNSNLDIIKMDNIKKILISSDGIDSFINKQTGKKTLSKYLINEIIDFKNLNGNFLKRNMKSKRGILNNLKKENIYNMDDLSIGCIYNDED